MNEREKTEYSAKESITLESAQNIAGTVSGTSL